MKYYKRLIFFCCLLCLLVFGCRERTSVPDKIKIDATELIETDSVSVDSIITNIPDLSELADTTFIRLADYSDDFEYDMRYATADNFLKAKVYDCAECYTRVKTAKALLQANKDFMKLGYKIKFYDCYRPNSVQYKMWEIVPNPQYVANPVKGSIHNRGGAVDITLVRIEGEELDMGTDFDFFGRRAYHDNMDLPDEILQNRSVLKETMERHGFWSIRTEWWHYNLAEASRDRVANFRWPCP